MSTSSELPGTAAGAVARPRTVAAARSSAAGGSAPLEDVVQLQLGQIAYQCALATTARVLQPSLLDFLR